MKQTKALGRRKKGKLKQLEELAETDPAWQEQFGEKQVPPSEQRMKIAEKILETDAFSSVINAIAFHSVDDSTKKLFFSAEGGQIVTLTIDTKTKTYKSEGSAQLLESNEPVIALGCNHNYIWTASPSNLIYSYDINTKPFARTAKANYSLKDALSFLPELNTASFSRDCIMLAAYSADNWLRLFELRRSRPRLMLASDLPKDWSLKGVAIHPKEDYLTIIEDYNIRFLKILYPRLELGDCFNDTHSEKLTAVAYHPDGEHILFGTAYGPHLYRINRDKKIHDQQDYYGGEETTALAISDDGKYMAWSEPDNKIRVFGLK